MDRGGCMFQGDLFSRELHAMLAEQSASAAAELRDMAERARHCEPRVSERCALWSNLCYSGYLVHDAIAKGVLR